jgi:hypothetical protein
VIRGWVYSSYCRRISDENSLFLPLSKGEDAIARTYLVVVDTEFFCAVLFPLSQREGIKGRGKLSVVRILWHRPVDVHQVEVAAALVESAALEATGGIDAAFRTQHVDRGRLLGSGQGPAFDEFLQGLNPIAVQ